MPDALRSIPLLGIIPLFIVSLGIGNLPKILIVVLGALLPMYVNTFAGIRSVDPKLRELGQVLGLTRRELITQIVLPGRSRQRSRGCGWGGRLAARAGRRRAGQRQPASAS